MSKRRFLLTNMGSLGDLHPFMGMALELMRAGHEVLFVSGESYRDYVESFGIAFASVRPNFHPNDPELLAIVLDRMNGPKRLHKDLVFGRIRETYEDFIKLAGGYDVIVGGTLGFFVPTVAEMLGVPWVSVTLSPVLLWSAHDVPVIPQWPPAARLLRMAGPRFTKGYLDLVLRFVDSWAANLHELRRDLGLPRSRGLYRGMMASPHLNLMLFSSVFAAPQPDWPAPYAQCGFVDFDGKTGAIAPEVESFLAQGPAPILFTLGSTASEFDVAMLRTFVDYAKQSSHRVLFVVGKKNEAELRSQNSERLHFASYVPYGEIMPRCRLVVHQGGIGTTAQAMKSGNPSLIVADVNDQPDNGDHLARTGAGEWIPASKLSVKRLAQKIDELLASEPIKRRASEVAAKLSAESGATNAARALESLLK
ncbi:MAG TPA: glycosyltransferase [Bdellovibrionota bacterium]|nr:glycosyltransferase [Bdellovibrionota bacterium]